MAAVLSRIVASFAREDTRLYTGMRKFVKIIAIMVVFVVTMSILWVIAGRPISLFLDRFGTVETTSMPIKSIAYESSGTNGLLHIDDMALSLSPADQRSLPPNMGTTKHGQLALSFGGKVFAFARLRSAEEALAAEVPPGDDASITVRHSVLSWPTILDFNFMTGRSPTWKRHVYNRLIWKKQDSAKLEMIWRYEQYCYPGEGWASGTMTREGVTGLIRVDISANAR